MATLDSPLEALAFEYVSFGVLAIVNNVWTWIAVVTAAVSFWRMRVTTIDRDDGRQGSGLLEEQTASKTEQETQAVAGPVKETAVARVKETVVMTTEVWETLICDDGVTKGKMTMYYGVDVDGRRDVAGDGELTSAVNYGGGLGDCGEWWERWERVVKMRNGDEDWYRYVDLMVINGNVVRLWDDKRSL